MFRVEFSESQIGLEKTLAQQEMEKVFKRNIW
jgi:hypothetical protein